MPIGERRHRCRGATFVLLMFWLAIAGAGLAALGSAWSMAALRGKEAELRFRGAQIRAALESYDKATPAGLPRAPQQLAELLDDRRGAQPRRHLRRLYDDPFTGQPDWELLLRDGRISGVRSRAAAPVMRAPPGALRAADAQARDWLFAARPTTGAAAPAGQTP